MRAIAENNEQSQIFSHFAHFLNAKTGEFLYVKGCMDNAGLGAPVLIFLPWLAYILIE